MRTMRRPPQGEEGKQFYLEHIRFIKGIAIGVILAQIISALTEGGAFFLAVKSQAEIFGFWASLAIGAIGGIVGVLLIEIFGLRFLVPKFTHMVAKQQANNPAHLPIFIIVTALLLPLIALSIFGSLAGKTEAINSTLEKQIQKVETQFNAALAKAKADIHATYRSDSLAIERQHIPTYQAQERKYEALAVQAETKIEEFEARDARGERWAASHIQKWKKKLAEIQVQATDTLAVLDAIKQTELTSRRHQYDRDLIDARNKNHTQKSRKTAALEAKKSSYNKGGLWLILFCQIFAILGIVAREIFYIRSGATELIQPTPYEFLGNSKKAMRIAKQERREQQRWEAINNYREETKNAPGYIPPEIIIDASPQVMKIQKLEPPTEQGEAEPSNHETINPPPEPQAQTDAIAHLRKASVLRAQGRKDAARAEELKADDIIRAYLSRDGRTCTDKDVRGFRGQLKTHLNNRQKPNPFDLDRQQIGFRYNASVITHSSTNKKTQPKTRVAAVQGGQKLIVKNQASNEKKTHASTSKKTLATPSTDNPKTVELGKKNCDQCGKEFQMMKHDHRFCSEKCRKKWHAQKHNGIEFNPNLFNQKS